MKAGNRISKVIWRKPFDNQIFSLKDTGGKDKFILAPFNKNEKSITLSGVISECDTDSIAQFFTEIALNEVQNKISTVQEAYMKSVNNAIKAIDHHHFDKVVLARRFFISKYIKLEALFLCLTAEYKGAFVYCYVLEDGSCMIGATPETLLKKNEESIFIEALGGTGQMNGFSEKEFLEHQHIITDISQKLKAQSYTFDMSETSVKKAGNVSHLSTIFTLRSQTITDDLNLLNALHPTSAVCGLPYQAAYDFLRKEETFNRHFYSGYLGFRKDGDLNFYVNLRCAEIFSNGAVLYAGAGISKDSSPEQEWLETSHKLDTLLRCIQ